MTRNLTWEAVQQMILNMRALLAPPWDMLRGEVRLQYSEYASFGQFYVCDVTAVCDDSHKMVVCHRDTADLAIIELCKTWPPISRLPREKQEIELAAFYMWIALQKGMRL